MDFKRQDPTPKWRNGKPNLFGLNQQTVFSKPGLGPFETFLNASKIKVRAVMVSPQTGHDVRATVLDRFANHAMDSTTKLEKQISALLIAKLGGELVASTPASKSVEDETSKFVDQQPHAAGWLVAHERQRQGSHGTIPWQVFEVCRLYPHQRDAGSWTN